MEGEVRLMLTFLTRFRPVDGAIVALTTIAVSLTLVHWNRIFADASVDVPVVLAALVGGLGALIAMRGGLRSLASTAVAIVVGLVGLAAWYNTSVADLPGDFISSWKGLASTGLKIPTFREFVIVPTILAFASAWAIVDITARRRVGAAVALPLTVVHGAAIAYSISAGRSPWWYAVAVGASVLGLILLSTVDRPLAQEMQETAKARAAAGAETGPTRIRWRQAAVAAPIIGLLALGGAGLNRSLASRDDEAFDLRERLVRPLDVFEATTPLARVKGGLVEPAPVGVFTISLEGLGPDDSVQFIPIASLDQYDGAVWTSSARFESAGAVLNQPAQLVRTSDQSIVQVVDLTDDYPFRFLPRVGVLTENTAGEIGWDPRSGSIARPSDSIDERFQSTQVLRLDPEEAEPSLDGPPSSVRYAATPPTLSEDQIPIFESFLADATEGATSEWDRLLRLNEWLRSDNFGYNTEAPAGHSLAALASYLDPGEAGEDAVRAGFSEQSASVFAIAARQLGVPSRVVVGYRLPEGSTLTAENSQILVTEDMIYAWPEVWVSGTGWTRFDPTNTGNETLEQTARTPAVSSEGEEAQISDLPELQEPVLIPEEGAGNSVLQRFMWPIILLALPLLYLLGLFIAKRVRRSRRRRAKSTADRTVGAWLETRDRLGSLGLPTDKSSSVADLADVLDLRDLSPVADEVSSMSPLVDAALFSPSEPDAQIAEQAWSAADGAIAVAKKSQPLATRVRASVHPSSIVGK